MGYGMKPKKMIKPKKIIRKTTKKKTKKGR